MQFSYQSPTIYYSISNGGFMKYFLTSFIVLLFFSCSTSQDQLSTEEMIKEKEAVIAVLNAYNKAYEQKNFPAMVDYLANDLTFFGSDSAEVIKSLTEFKEQIQKQWADMDTIRYGKMTDIFVLIDPKGKIASVIYGIPMDIWTKDSNIHLFLRVSRTLKKEGGRWVIVSGITSLTRASKSATEILEQLNK